MIESHKFIPVYLGASAGSALAGLSAFSTRPHDWLRVSVAELPSPGGSCMAHLFACGVVVLHLRQNLSLDRLGALASWRYSSYEADLGWATEQVERLLATASIACKGRPEYVLSIYVVQEPAWHGDQLGSALRLLCQPSVLVDRRTDRPDPVDEETEQRLLADGFDQSAIVPFGVSGVSVGYAGWSGMSYHAIAPERALSVDEIVACEVDIQMLWAYCRHVQGQVEDGRDPVVPPEFGWRFLRAAHSRLTTARTRESAQHCMMREAALVTSGLPDRLLQAQSALRESGAVGVGV
nr:hypothetical protein [Micromonospora sp. DSM 115978]